VTAVTKSAGYFCWRSTQSRNMHPTRIGNLALDHALTVGGYDLAEFRNRELLTILGDQVVDVQSTTAIAAVARNLKDRESVADLAEGDVAGRHGGFLFTPMARLPPGGDQPGRPPTSIAR
jgi:hypothetical protein